MGKTDSVLNILCERLDDNAVPALYVGPTRSNVEKIIEPRLMAALRSSSRLWSSIARTKLGKTAKRISGVLVRLAWAGSATELASQEAGLAILDEIDRMKIDVEGEGNPIELVDARLATFIDNLMVLTSTPTEGNVVEETNPETKLTHWKVAEASAVSSAIWKLWQEGTRFEWAWPCPDCGEYFIPRFSLMKWNPGSTPTQAAREARMKCPHCGVLIGDEKKKDMNARGRFAAPGQRITKDGDVIGQVPENDHYSFWISGLCSPWRSFGYRVRAFLQAVRSADTNRVKTAVNTGLGELYRIGGDVPEWQEVKKTLAGGYALGQMPAIDPLWLTCGVDVQKNRLVYAVRGWTYGLESYLIEFNEIYGDPATDDPWNTLRDYVFARDYGGGNYIRKAVIDSGYKPGEELSDNIIYKFCRHNPIAVPSKGHDTQAKPFFASVIDVKENGQLIKKGLMLWHLDTDYMKSFVHGRLKQKPGVPGMWHLPFDVTEDYCQQLVAEARVSKPSGKAVWVRLRGENHALDCEAMNVAAIHMLGGHMMRRPALAPAPPAAGDGSATPTEDAAISPPPEVPSEVQTPQQRSAAQKWAVAPRAPGSFVTGWRK